VCNCSIPTWYDRGAVWDAPSFFVLFSNGDYALSAARYYNGMLTTGRPFSLRWWLHAQYKLTKDGAPVYSTIYLADDEGYQAGTANVVKNGTDAGFVQYLDQAQWITYWQSHEPHY
jgi:hypothetical protein